MPPTTKYLWSNGNIIAEADETDTINVMYTYEPQQYGNLISTEIQGTTYYHHYDALGSTRQLTDAAGSVTDRMTYDAWGNIVSRTGTTRISMLWIGELGYYYDVETGPLSVRERTYWPTIGRWLCVDPLLPVSGTMQYAYAANSPVLTVDPSGLSPDHCHEKPAGIQYVAGRGQFILGKIIPLNNSDLESSVTISWAPFDQTSFLQSNCCCCTSIGFIQIAKTTFISTNIVANLRSRDWEVDGCPVSYPVTQPNAPCGNKSQIPALMTDRPQVPVAVPWLNTAYFAEQEFETCAICISGNEGIDQTIEIVNPQYALFNTIVSGVTVYGCIRWSHTFNIEQNEKSVRMNGGFMTSRNPQFYLEGLKVEQYNGIGPSDTFNKLVINTFRNPIPGINCAPNV